MNVSLTPELENFINNKVTSGLYTSASEVIRESLRLLNTYDELQKKRIQQLNNDINIGLEQLGKGMGIKAENVYHDLHEKINSKL